MYGFVVVVQLISCVQLFATPWTAECQASLSFTISLSLLRLMSIKTVVPSNLLILCCCRLLLPSIFPIIRIFPVSWLLASGSQSIGASASASVLLMNIQCWFPLGLTGLISLLYKGLSRVFSEYSLSLKACHTALKLLTLKYLARKGFIIRIPY